MEEKDIVFVVVAGNGDGMFWAKCDYPGCNWMSYTTTSSVQAGIDAREHEHA